MEILQLLLSNENYIFSAAIFLMLAIAVLEGVLVIIGLGISSFFHMAFPNLDVSVDVPDIDHSLSLSSFFNWINSGRVPLLMLFIVFLTIFGLVGLSIQHITNNVFSQFFMIIPTLFITLPIVRISSVYLSKIMPQDETSVVSTTSFIGQIAEITNGTTVKGITTEAKLKDVYNKTHYIMVEAINEGDSFKKGDKVLILSQDGYKFYVSEDVNKNLIKESEET